jgi:uncharacterized membrane protein YjjB (DUF3815 family)
VEIILQLFGAYWVGVFASLTLEAPRKVLYWTPIINIAGWGAYMLGMEFLGLSMLLTTYFGSLVIAILSHIFARIFKEPVTIFFIPAFFLFVPGGGMYRTALAFIQGDSAKGMNELGLTLFTALAIALAVYTADTVIHIWNRQKFPKFVRKNYRVLPTTNKRKPKK